MKKERLRHYANILASRADRPWIGPFFALLFFLDAIFSVFPSDSLLAAVVVIQPKHVKSWTLYASIGFALGLGLLTLLANSHLQPLFYQWLENWGYGENISSTLQEISLHGYGGLTLGAFTFVPCPISILAGIMVGLNPRIVFLITALGKYTKFFLMIWVALSGSNRMRKFAKKYLKAPI